MCCTTNIKFEYIMKNKKINEYISICVPDNNGPLKLMNNYTDGALLKQFPLKI